MTATIDHLVYACPDLTAAVDEIARLTGVRPGYGGQHPGLGTHNALLSLGDRTYLEIIAPDPAQPRTGSLPFGLEELTAPALRAWAAAPEDIDNAAREARAEGFDYGEVVTRQRRTLSDGELSWRMTNYPHNSDVAVIPFLIDWGHSRHPAQTAPSGLRLSEFRILAPDPDKVARQLHAASIDLPVDRADAPALRAVLTGPSDVRVVLTS
ncbi:MAG TPA: VOC family protein [Streptosporangiaceae bacterium]|nr:VOC family protein [Streptosporangiaceae bacterium]